MTRSHKANDRDHHHQTEPGQSVAAEQLPKFFGKHGFVDVDPKKVKKEGGGKGNWGRSGDEIEDGTFNFTKSRRRSNSFVDSHPSGRNYTTKFETNEEDPVFEEDVHGPTEDDMKEFRSRHGSDADAADAKSVATGDSASTTEGSEMDKN